MVKLDEVTNEKCFPRGGGSEKPKSVKKEGKASFPSKQGLKRKAVDSEENEAKKVKEESSWIPKVDDNMFIEGLTGLGVVAEVYDDGVMLHTSAAQSVRIDVGEVSKKFSELINAEKIEMKDVFQVGQMVPFRVLSKKVKGEKGKIKGSCNPAKLNKHLSPNMLVAGLAIHTSVVSIEEKGAILDIGLDQMTGFIEKSQFPPTGLKEGYPLIVRILSSTSRVVKVTSFVEQDNLNMATCEKLQLNNLMPGTVLECEPTGDALTGGVVVSIGNGLKGILPRRNLPPRLRENPEKLGKAIRAVVMFCQQNSKVLVLSAHPDIVAVSKIEKRTNFDGFSLGDKVKCTVIDVIGSKSIVYFELPATDGKKSLVTGFSSRGLLEKPDAAATEYKVGTEKLCRVTGFRYADRSLMVSTRKDIILQKITSYKDAVCGDILDAQVRYVSKSGVHFTVCHFVKAFAPLHLLSDKPLAGKWKGKFKLGAQMKVRVWQVCEERRNLVVSCREQMIQLKATSANSIENLAVGNTVPCLVKKVFPTGVLLLKTYNNICGVLRKESSCHIPGAKLNDYVAANVEKIEENNRLVFVLADASKSAVTNDQKTVDEKKVVLRAKAVDKFIEIGHVYEGGLTAKKNDKASVTFNGNNGDVVYSVVDDYLLSDLLEAPIGLTKRILEENTQQIDRIVPMGKLAAINRASVKRSVAKWAKTNEIPSSFEDLLECQVVLGVITQIITNVGVFIELIGGSGLTGKVFERKTGKRACDLFEVGQVVLGKIESIDASKKNFNVDPIVEMNNGDLMLEDHGIPLLECIVDEVKWLSENTKYPTPGTQVKAKVTKELDDLTLVEFDFNGKNIAGVVHKSTGGSETPGKKKVKTLFVVDINHSTNEVVLAAPSDQYRIVAARRDYLCTVDKEGLIYLPTRLHHNHLPELDSIAKLHDIIEVENIKKHGSVRIGVRGGGNVDDAARARAVSQVFSGDSEKKASTDKKTVSLKGDSVKNFGIYEAIVIGEVKSEAGQKKNRLFAELKLPGDNIGRLHVSELPSNLLNAGEKPLESFLKRNKNKKVTVRVIGFQKHGKSKIADLTMISNKIRSGKVRAANMAYQSRFEVGDLVNCFGSVSLSDAVSDIPVEVNALFSGRVSRENISDDLKVKTADGGIIDLSIESGEMREARVIGVDKKNKFCLTLSLDVKQETQEFETGKKVTGRIFSIEKSVIRMKLSSGQQALLTPTGISDKYESYDEYVKKHFNVKDLVQVVCAHMTEAPKKRYYVALVERFDQTENYENEMRKLILDRSTIESGQEMDAIVKNATKGALLVELGPGIEGMIQVTEENEEILEIGSDSVIRVKVEKVTDKEIKLSLSDIIIRKWAVRNRKRNASTSKDVPSKVSLVEDDSAKKTLDTEDPGFDWSNKGFRNEDLAAVGKLTTKNEEDKDIESSDDEDEEEEEENSDVDNEEESGEESDEEVEENGQKSKKKSESNVVVEETEEELSKLLRSDRNSAILWIKYMSLFLEKSDLTAARATAERAIETINYREAGELRNMWTAYLNMEVAYGDASTVQKVFERACNNSDSYTIHLQLAQIYQNASKNAEAKQILETMVRKFRAQHMDVWTLLAEHHMKHKETKAARELFTRALTSVPKQNHTKLISKFAQLEFKFGDSERGTTLFEGLITAHPKKTDLWLVYADAALKHLGVEQARKVLEKACNAATGMHKTRPLYKKWLEIETRHGDAASIELVRSKAEKYLQSVAETVLADD